MKKILISKLVFLCLLSTGQLIQGVVTAGATLRKDGKTVWLLSNLTADSEPSMRQKNILIDAAQAMRASIITQDPFNNVHIRSFYPPDAQSGLSEMQERADRFSPQDVCVGLITSARKKNIATVNTDFQTWAIKEEGTATSFVKECLSKIKPMIQEEWNFLIKKHKDIIPSPSWFVSLQRTQHASTAQFSEQLNRQYATLIQLFETIFAFKMVRTLQHEQIIVCGDPEHIFRLSCFLRSDNWEGDTGTLQECCKDALEEKQLAPIDLERFFAQISSSSQPISFSGPIASSSDGASAPVATTVTEASADSGNPEVIEPATPETEPAKEQAPEVTVSQPQSFFAQYFNVPCIAKLTVGVAVCAVVATVAYKTGFAGRLYKSICSFLGK